MAGDQINPVCPECNRKAFGVENSIKCDGQCNAYYHGQCLNLKTHQVKRLQHERPFFCKTCTATSNNTSSTATADENATPTAATMSIDNNQFHQIMQAIKEIKTDFNSEMREIKKNTEFLSDQFDTLNQEIKKLSAMETDIRSIKAENKMLVTKVSALESKVATLQLHAVANEIVIENVPMTSGENLLEIYKKVGTRIAAADTVSQVADIKRLINKKKLQPCISHHQYLSNFKQLLPGILSFRRRNQLG